MADFSSKLSTSKNSEKIIINIYIGKSGIIKMSSGKEAVNRIVRNIPSKPGVYRMLDANNNILYIGKAKNLKKRVKSY